MSIDNSLKSDARFSAAARWLSSSGDIQKPEEHRLQLRGIPEVEIVAVKEATQVYIDVKTEQLKEAVELVQNSKSAVLFYLLLGRILLAKYQGTPNSNSLPLL